MTQEFQRSSIPLSISGTSVTISALCRQGPKAPVLLLHGFGSTKEDYADIVRHGVFEGRAFAAYDAPGCGETDCADLTKVDIPFLLDTAAAVAGHFGFERFHLVGHSMGGLTALMLSSQLPQRVLSFINIEGNIAPEDCFLSRQIDQYPSDSAEQFFAEFIERALHAPAYASALYSSSLRHKVRADAVPSIFRSMVSLSDNGDLMRKFLGFPFPRMFMYGEQNSNLTYLSHIESKGVELAEIPNCGHFPMYSNPVAMWKAIGDFIERAESTSRKVLRVTTTPR
ncbi:alpha/beta hydrolase [Paraburkholderia sp. BL17N1]|uniref:alpha/beta fold hydrolase n=1 Tax=Paraburkholderia sp. BL17N1 TaxID=1938798 RepID=UPI000EAC5C28|nr:alpha/beta hydrolase [Paraburkholderia sp. BL17N1]